jgi:hypothetical protein
MADMQRCRCSAESLSIVFNRFSRVDDTKIPLFHQNPKRFPTFCYTLFLFSSHLPQNVRTKTVKRKKTRHADVHNEFSYGLIEQKTWST